MKVLNLFALALAVALFAGCTKPDAATTLNPPSLDALLPTHAQPKLPTMKIYLGAETFDAELALTDDEEMTGMMFRTNIQETDAMLFVLPQPQRANFWMKNCPESISAAYITPDGIIREIHHLEQNDTNGVIAARASDAAQKSKLVPVIKKLRAAKILVSVETYSPAVTRATLEAGANVLNLTGTTGSKEIFKMVAAHDAAVIICYVAGKNVREVSDFDLSADPIPMLREFFARQIELAQSGGLKKIFIDPGLGFYYRNLQDSAMRVRHQMNIFLNTFRLRELGFPVCHALPHAFEFFGDEVRCAEPFFAVLAALGKTELFRTHEVPRIKAVLDTLKAF